MDCFRTYALLLAAAALLLCTEAGAETAAPDESGPVAPEATEAAETPESQPEAGADSSPDPAPDAEESEAEETEAEETEAEETEAEETEASGVAVLGVTAAPDLLDQLPHVVDALRRAVTATETEMPTAEELRSRRDATLTEEDAMPSVAELRAQVRSHLLAFDFSLARGVLETARNLIRARFGDLLGDPELGQIDLELARVLLDMHRRAEAISVLLEVAHCAPELEPSAADFPPSLLTAWREVRAGADLPPDASLERPGRGRLTRAAAVLGVAATLTGEISRAEDDRLAVRLTLVSSDTEAEERVALVALGTSEPWEQTLLPAVRALLAIQSPFPPPPPVSRLLVLSTPVGAEITVDGAAVEDPTPATVTVSPGRHLLSLTLAGHEPAELHVTAWPQQTIPVEVNLEPLPRNLGRRLWWLWTLVGAVAAGAAAGFIYWGVTAAQDQPDAVIVPQ